MQLSESINYLKLRASWKQCRVQFSSVQLLSYVWLFATPWNGASQASLSITNSQSLPKLMSIGSVMTFNHLILCHPLLFPPSIFPSIRVFSKESVFLIRWPKYWSFSFSITFLYSKFLLASLCLLWTIFLLPREPHLVISFSSVQSLSCVQLFATPWTAACQASLSVTNSWSLLKPMSTESVMPSNHLVLCHPLFLLPSIFPSIRVFSNESVLRIRWPKYWNFSFRISPSNEYSGLISFRIDWFDLLAVQGTLKCLLQHHNSKASILWHSAFFMVQLSHLCLTTGKTIALIIWTFVLGKDRKFANSVDRSTSSVIY